MQIIPTKKTPALIGYYTGVFSLIPCFALILGPTACILGFLGLKRVKEDPEVSGTVHSWIAIVLGGLMFVLNAVVLGFGMFGA